MWFLRVVNITLLKSPIQKKNRTRRLWHLCLDYIANLDKGITLEQLELLLIVHTTRKTYVKFINITVDDYDNVILYLFRNSEWSFDIERQIESSFFLATQVLQETIGDEEKTNMKSTELMNSLIVNYVSRNIS